MYVKKKLSMRAGETEKAELVDDLVLIELGEKLGTVLRHIGNLDCDVFLDGNVATVLELNPRFGGGYPFSHTLGANFPNAILRWYRSDLIEKSNFVRKTGQVISKCDDLIFINL